MTLPVSSAYVSTTATRSRILSLPEASGYWEHSRRPLHVLAFLLPFILIFELGVLLLRGDLSNVAHLTLLRFFDAFGIPAVGGLYMGGIAIVVVLLTWQFLASYSWRIHPWVLGIMFLEAAALAIPLLLVNQLIGTIDAQASATIGGAAGGEGWWRTLIVSSVGAGLYEELIFRMMLIGALHTLLVDVVGASARFGSGIAIVISAAAFAWYHTIGQTAVPPLSMVFFFIAGLYFGALFLMRGFGIVVGAHAFHNIVVYVT